MQRHFPNTLGFVGRSPVSMTKRAWNISRVPGSPRKYYRRCVRVRFVHRWIHRRWRDGVGSDGIGTRRARREQSGRAIRTDEKDGANWCKRSKYDPRPRRKTFGIVVKLFQPMAKGRDVTLFPRLEVEQSGRSVKSMAVVSRSSITRAARASIYRRWRRFFREVDSR